MKEKYLRIIIYIVGLICVYAFSAVRIFPLMNAVLYEKMDQETQDFNKYGDLYYFSCISEFREDYPPRVRKYRYSNDNPEINEADILTYGDSFFDIIFTKSLPEKLSDTLNARVYSYVTQDPIQANPFCLLSTANYQAGDNPKFFIYETVERNIPVKFSQEYPIHCSATASDGFSRVYDGLLNIVFRKNSENLYEVMLKQSFFTHRVYAGIASLKFNCFGYISPLTAKYKTGDSPWLFYDKEYGTDPGNFYYQYTDAEIGLYADNIARLKNSLLEQYNLQLVFLPIPNKYSVYHKVINKDQYNGFLPKLFKELDKRQVCYVDVYHAFKNNPEPLYYGTDTHWNEKGIDIALNLTLEKMDNHHSLSLNNSFDPGNSIHLTD
jgi:hypothetical protein